MKKTAAKLSLALTIKIRRYLLETSSEMLHSKVNKILLLEKKKSPKSA